MIDKSFQVGDLVKIKDIYGPEMIVHECFIENNCRKIRCIYFSDNGKFRTICVVEKVLEFVHSQEDL